MLQELAGGFPGLHSEKKQAAEYSGGLLQSILFILLNLFF